MKDSSKGTSHALYRAAEYVRMSTEHQQYSTLNQVAKIREYAAQRGIEIVRTYADEGKSGLTIGGRQSLQNLIRDVESGSADYNMILVYDVSRWGRFQDADESAYYEYICRRSGIQVTYCAEQFENDGSPVSTIVKGVKRAMAGEYSRELSAKVFAGQCRLIELGFRQGGPAGFGLRRVLVDQGGVEKAELKRGEHKSLQTDRVILKPGPATEINIVNQIYNWFVEDQLHESAIAACLNDMGVKTALDRSWTRATVHEVLTNEKYIGSNVYNRKSFKLKKLRVVNEPDMWIRKDGAFTPIVAQDLFYTAKGIIRARARRFSNEELLDQLRVLYQDRGYLSGLIINETDSMPSPTVYTHRFGSLIRAYQLVGFSPKRDYAYVEINRMLRRLHPEILTDTEKQISHLGGAIYRNPLNDLLDFNHEFTVSVVFARCQSSVTGNKRWNIRFDTTLRPDITVAIRLAPGNQKPLDYYLLPSLGFGQERIRLAEQNAIEFESYRFDNHRINRLSTIQEHLMIRRAVDRGVSIERLTKVLCLDTTGVQKRLSLLEGICPEAAELLKNRIFSLKVTAVLRNMKPTRQVECAELMISANTLTLPYAQSLLLATAPELLLKAPRRSKTITREQIARMEREMKSLQGNYKAAEQTYGDDMLNLVLARGYLVKILENTQVGRFLMQHHPEVLTEFTTLVQTTSLDL